MPVDSTHPICKFGLYTSSQIGVCCSDSRTLCSE